MYKKMINLNKENFLFKSHYLSLRSCLVPYIVLKMCFPINLFVKKDIKQ